jgi:type II secretory pathway predicted ATPase ExeA
VDTGLLDLLRDIADNRLVVLGRTGSGKSALLAILEQTLGRQVIRIVPEQLALTYVANSTVLNFFNSLGVNLDPFFKLLWRHVFTVEILTRHFSEPSEPQSKSLLDRLKTIFMGASRQDKEMRQAIAYLEEWGQSFWLDTEYRVKEITTHLETKLNAELKATLGAKAAAIGSSARAEEKFSESERKELISRGQNVISRAQVQDLHKVVRLLDAVLTDKQRGYYLVVDNLDENWVEETLRYKLIMSLMQTARDFNEVRYAKVIIALRRDLIERVFRLTRESGFQEEKYQSLYLPLKWKKATILEVIDRRINKLVERRYTKVAVSHRECLPREFRRIPIGDYIFSVAPRPRDVIALFNACIVAATDQARLGVKELRLAEGEYSRSRLRALADEWSADYPTLADFASILQRRPPSFKVKTITDTEVEDLCLQVASENPGSMGLLQSAMQVVDVVLPAKLFKFSLIRTFYQVGLVGLKLAPHESESWADEVGRSVSFAEITDETSVVVHSAYRRALGVHDA